MPIIYPARPEHDQAPAAPVVFGVSGPALEPWPVPLHLVADLPATFLAHVEAGDWHLYALDFDSSAVYAIAMWVDNPNGEDFPLFVVDASLIEGSAAVRAALRALVDRVLDTEAKRVCYMRLPADVSDAAALATAQRAEWHVDVSDAAFAELAARAEYDPAAWQAYGCPDCGHLPGCGCDCCPYPMPAVAGAEQLVGGVRS